MRKLTMLFVLLPVLALAQIGINNNSLIINTNNWDDSMVPALDITTGATAPSLTDGFSGLSILKYYSFQGGTSTNDQCWFNLQIPHSYIVGSDLEPHVHYAKVTADTGAVVWELVYTVASISDTFTVSDTLTVRSEAAAGQWVHHIAGFPTVQGTAFRNSGNILGISHIWMCRLRRLDSEALDTYPGAAAFLGFDVHFRKDGLGSGQETIK